MEGWAAWTPRKERTRTRECIDQAAVIKDKPLDAGRSPAVRDEAESSGPANVTGVDAILLQQRMHSCQAHGNHILLIPCEGHVPLAKPQGVLARLHLVVGLQVFLGHLRGAHRLVLALTEACWPARPGLGLCQGGKVT